MGFPERLAELRSKFHMTQKELAKQIGVSRGTIGMYEIGRRDPDTDTIIKLTKIFAVSADYLIGISDIPNPYNNIADNTQEIDNTQDKINGAKESSSDEDYFTIEDLRAFIRERNKRKKAGK